MSGHLANPNLDRLTIAAERLAPLLSQIAFVGGCVTGLLFTDPGAAPIRTTLDVGAIVRSLPMLSSRDSSISF